MDLGLGLAGIWEVEGLLEWESWRTYRCRFKLWGVGGLGILWAFQDSRISGVGGRRVSMFEGVGL